MMSPLFRFSNDDVTVLLRKYKTMSEQILKNIVIKQTTLGLIPFPFPYIRKHVCLKRYIIGCIQGVLQ